MNIWLIMSGEPLEQFGERPHRIGMLSKMLVGQGHNVTWFTTSYDHQYKKYFYDKTTKVKNGFGLDMVFLHSDSMYKKNISLSRIKNHKEVSLVFTKVAEKEEIPDIILCAFPTIDLAYKAVRYGKEFNVPVVIDVRDLWPDIFINPFPKMIHPLLKIFLKGYIRQTTYIFENCSSVIGVSQKYLDYGLKYGSRIQNTNDKVYPLAYQPQVLDDKIYRECEDKYKKLGIDKEKIIVWFVGTFGRTYDLSKIIEVAKEINDDNIQFILTGDGENAIAWKEMAKENKNIIFTGWVNQNDLTYLSDIANVGLMAYRKGAPQGLPNKIFEYLSAGLPILSSLQSETKTLLKNENVGFTYDADNKEEFKMLLLRLITNKELLKSMSTNCKLFFKKSYSANSVYSNLVEYLEHTVKEYRNV